MSTVLYDMIHKRSEATWGDRICTTHSEDFRLWAEHWFKCAAEIRDEFKAEGLLQTAEGMQKIIDEQIKLNPCKEVLNGKTA